MKIVDSKAWFKTATTIMVIGYSLCLGSIASFTSMDMLAGKQPTVEFWYWQRLFVNSIINFVTTPGIWLFLFGNLGLFLASRRERKKADIILLILPILLVINVQINLNPVAKIINRLSIQQVQTSTFIKDFATKKNIEDIFGEINLFLLLVYLVVYILSTSKPKI